MKSLSGQILCGIISLILLTGVLNQATTTATVTASSSLPTNSSQLLPSGQLLGSSSQVPPSGNNSTNINGSQASAQAGFEAMPTGSSAPPSNLPPPRPLLTSALYNINDAFLNNYKPLLSLLTPQEQDTIAACFLSNKDTTRMVDPDCFKATFETIKSSSAQGIGAELTNNSKNTRNSLGCLSKMTQTYSDTTDNSTTTITSELSSIVTTQTTVNNCAAIFSKTVLEILNTRRRFFITTKDNILQTQTKDSAGRINGFIFTDTEQKTIVASFKTYALCLSTFVSTLSSKVVSVQALIGTLGKCKPPASTATATTNLQGTTTGSVAPQQTAASATTNTTASGSAQQPQGSSSGTQPSKSGSKPIVTIGTDGKPVFQVPQGFKDEAKTIYDSVMKLSGTNWNTIGGKLSANIINQSTTGDVPRNMPSLHRNVIDKFDTTSDWIKKAFNMGEKKDACTADYAFICTGGKCACSDSGCPSSVSGSYDITIKKSTLQFATDTSSTTGSVRLLQTATTGTLPPPPTGTTGTQPAPTGTTTGTQPPQGTTTGTQPPQGTTTGTQPPQGTTTGTQPPQGTTTGTQPPQGTTTGTQPPQGTTTGTTGTSGTQPPTGTTGTSGTQPPTGTTGTSQIMPSGTHSTMPSGANSTMPSGANSTMPSGAQSSGNTPRPSDSFAPPRDVKNPGDELTSYYLVSACVGGSRFIYSEATFEKSGFNFDFMTKNNDGGGMGAAMAQQVNDCSAAFASGTTTQKQNCRGPINEACAGDMDGTCKNSGLYDVVSNSPQTKSPYPDVCNDSYATTGQSSDSLCFAWVVNAITKGTITFDYGNLGKLPQLINAGISSTTTTGLRYMATATANTNTVQTGTDASKSDSKAQVSGTISNSDLTVDSATATSVPNPNTYIDSLNSATVKTTISSSFVQMSLSLIMVMIFGLLF
jgi:hypothetical protein